MDLYDRAKDALVSLRATLEPVPPLVASTEGLIARTRGLIDHADATLGRCDVALERGPALLDAAESLLRTRAEVAALERDRLTLQLARERAGDA